MGAFIMVAGLYASINSIVDGTHIQSLMTIRGLEYELTSFLAGYRDGEFGGPFSCASRALK